MNEFQIKRATRQAFKPLIILYSESGCGKTYSALLLARGIAGPDGKIVMGDSESGRGSLYADILPGGYETFDIEPPFSPERYIKAVDAIEASGAAIGIIDSGSHEWEGIGGVCDMADKNEATSGKAGLHNWRAPKIQHALFIQRLLRSSIPLIICLRAKYKTRQKRENGKTAIIKDEYTSPIQAEDFIFEATCHAEILPKHNINLTKTGHPTLAECFPGLDDGPLTIDHGRKIAAWCASAGETQKTAPKPATAAGKTAKKDLWELTAKIHGGDKATLHQWLVDEALIDPSLTLEQLSETQISAVLTKARAKLR